MLIQQKTGKILLLPTNKKVDCVELQWYETNKRILHKNTRGGREIVMRFLKENQHLTQGDIIYEDPGLIIAIDVLCCDVIVINPRTTLEMAAICYEVGNRHIPLFFENDELLIAWENPLFNFLVFLGYDVRKAERKLITPLKTSVASHAVPGFGNVFSKIVIQPSSAE